MNRKLIKQGGGGYTVYLPKKWIDKKGLKEGEDVNIEVNDNNLIITSEAEKKKKEVTITLKVYNKSAISMIITNIYRKGYDKVIVNYEREEQFSHASSIIESRLIGFEITKKENNQFIIENITEPSVEKFDTIISKIFYNILELFNITKKRIQNNNSKYKKDIESIEQRILKYDNFCRRAISKTMNIEQSEPMWAFLSQINLGNRELYHLNDIIPIKISKNTIEFFDNAKQFFELIRETYIKKDIDNIGKIDTMEKELINKGQLLLTKTKGKEAIIIYYILSCIRNFYNSSSPLVGYII